jgi:hypothetical protein
MERRGGMEEWVEEEKERKGEMEGMKGRKMRKG